MISKKAFGPAARTSLRGGEFIVAIKQDDQCDIMVLPSRRNFSP
jgi:hypothetical protein